MSSTYILDAFSAPPGCAKGCGAADGRAVVRWRSKMSFSWSSAFLLIGLATLGLSAELDRVGVLLLDGRALEVDADGRGVELGRERAVTTTPIPATPPVSDESDPMPKLVDAGIAITVPARASSEETELPNFAVFPEDEALEDAIAAPNHQITWGLCD